MLAPSAFEALAPSWTPRPCAAITASGCVRSDLSRIPSLGAKHLYHVTSQSPKDRIVKDQKARINLSRIALLVGLALAGPAWTAETAETGKAPAQRKSGFLGIM